MELIHIEEGRREYLVPVSSIKGNAPNKSDEVFFNSYQEINRDISILMLRAYQIIHDVDSIKICEPLCGIGVRSCRYNQEILNSNLFSNDLNPKALAIFQQNISLLPQKSRKSIQLFNMEANQFLQHLNQEREIFDYIDIDPYGSPIPFVQNAIKILNFKGLIALTATDLANLAGVYPKALYAKYGLSHFDIRIGNIHEIAARALIAGIQRIALIHNQTLIPILTFYHRHFIRVFFVRYRGVKKIISETGFIIQCKKCHTIYSSTIGKINTCSSCNSTDSYSIGPIYLGLLHDANYITKILNDPHLSNLGTNYLLKKLIKRIEEEIQIPVPWSFHIPNIADQINSRLPPITQIMNLLKNKGFRCSRTHFSGSSIKTTAPLSEIITILKDYNYK
ncbi:hypothetical protein [Candidatus Hodarchaeum mangrovi]